VALTLNLSASEHLNKSLKIDAIRFLAAVWVLMDHFRPVFPEFGQRVRTRRAAMETSLSAKQGV
jgi:peptidoglycan/LPS O-acetylase OafA/YrhL